MIEGVADEGAWHQRGAALGNVVRVSSHPRVPNYVIGRDRGVE
jgi:hypothetical protein